MVLDPIGGNRFVAARGGGASWNGRPMRVSRRPELDGAFLATGYPFRAHAALDVYLDLFRDVFRRARAIRRCGAAALDLAYTAAGVYDGFFEFRLSPWDIAAGALLIEEAGGVLTDLDGGDDFLESRQRSGRRSRRPRRPARGRARQRLRGRSRPPRPALSGRGRPARRLLVSGCR